MSGRSTPQISDYFDADVTTEREHEWSHCKTRDDTDDNQLAWWLAAHIVRERVIDCPQYFESWQNKIERGVAIPATHADALRAFLRGIIGPDQATIGNADHLEGAVAEYLWYFLAREGIYCDTAVYVEPPKGEVTDKGGDGFAIHELDDGELWFRLWEVKKCTSSGGVSGSVSAAYDQLESKGTQYLAQFTSIGRRLGDARLATFCAQIPHYWLTAAPQAAAGIAVTTFRDNVPERSFTQLGRARLAQYASPNRLRGHIYSIRDFSAFALRVRDWIWSGL